MYNMWATLIIIGRATLQPAFRARLVESFKQFPPYYLAIPGLLDGLGSFLESVGGPNVPGSWTVLLGQSTVFFVMLFSCCLLRSRFNAGQIGGAVLTMIGSCLAVLPTLLGFTEEEEMGSGEMWTARMVGYTLIYFSADIPMALAAVYKDYAFKGAPRGFQSSYTMTNP